MSGRRRALLVAFVAWIVLLVTSGGGTPENASFFETPRGVRPRFAVVRLGEEMLLCSVRDADGALLAQRLSSSPDSDPPEPVVIYTGIEGAAYPVLNVDDDLVLLSFHDARDASIHIAASSDSGRSWELGRVRGVENATGWHDLAVAHDSLHLCYATEQRGVLMHAVVSGERGDWSASSPTAIDDEAVSKGSSYLTLQQSGDALVAVYNGAYDGFGQGKSLKVARIPLDETRPTINRVDGPGCSVGNLASTILSGDAFVTLAVDKAGPAVYRVGLQPDAPAQKTRIPGFDPDLRFSACAIAADGDSYVAVVQQWPRLVAVQIDSDVSPGPTRELFSGGRVKDEVPESDLAIIASASGWNLFFYDPERRTIRSLEIHRDEP